jgi:NhaP-type Na+/H+ or K+/H+ antiporter
MVTVSTTPKTSKNTTLWSATAVVVMACLLYSTLDWHRNTKAVVSRSRPTQRHLVKQQLQQQQESVFPIFSAPAIDDDFTRDETCRKYLVNFLNGTTDAKDECQGFYNAWKAADCQDDSHLTDHQVAWYFILDIFGLGKRHRAENGTVVEDDVVIDDYYENWECCSSITDFYAKHCQQAELDAFKMLGIVMVLVVCGFMKSLIRVTGLRWIPDAGACILVGSIVGGLLRVISPEVVKDKLTFDNDLFLQILLPPIIFEAAITINKRAFRRDLFPILTLAVFGTGFSAVAIGYITYHLSSWGSGASLPLLDSLLFGALMSSIDPVATLSILSGVGVVQSDTLYTLIFGESLLNDGVAIVLFNSLVQHMGDADVVDRATVHETLRDFVIVTLGSIAIGVVCGALCTFYFWALQGKHSAVTEVAMFFTWALIPYYVADGFGFSGIISTMVMGFMVDYFVIGGFQSDEGEWMEYMALRVHPADHHQVEPLLARCQAACAKAFSGRGHIGSRSRAHVGFVAEVIANLMETAIFAYLGLFLFNDTSFNFKLVVSGLISCISSRAVMVIVFSLLINICVWVDLEGLLGRIWYMVRRSNSRSISFDELSLPNDEKVYLDKKTQLILFSAGVRGAVSYALVQNIPVYDAVTKHGSKFKNELRAMTSSTIVVLLFAFGALTYFTVQRDLSRPDRERVAGPLTHRLMTSSALTSSEDLGDSSELNSLEIEDEAQPRHGHPIA